MKGGRRQQDPLLLARGGRRSRGSPMWRPTYTADSRRSTRSAPGCQTTWHGVHHRTRNGRVSWSSVMPLLGVLACALELKASTHAALQERLGKARCERVRRLPARAVSRDEEVGRQLGERVARRSDQRLKPRSAEMKAADDRV